MPRYAADTSVAVEKSRAEIEATLRRYGADAFVFAEDRGAVTIMFRINGRMVRFLLAMPGASQSTKVQEAIRHWIRSYREESK